MWRGSRPGFLSPSAEGPWGRRDDPWRPSSGGEKGEHMTYLLRKIGFYLLTLWIAITLNFAVPRLMPGDPASAMFAQFQGKMTPQEYVALKATLGFSNDNLFRQYLTYLSNILHLNFGTSLSHYPVPAATVIMTALLCTALLRSLRLLIT